LRIKGISVTSIELVSLQQLQRMRTDNQKLLWEDWLAIAIYFVFTIGLGLAVSIT
jgi:hypothetical protein